ncbi:MAG: phosphoribosylanthranilate isomerase [Synechococcus sp. LacPavin_0920_WC12_MAG_50_7]|nr:phosphoribosylanthranilate isomerase [Synechococcus sp. LacPavin_0920_WC12_MAG_50_7]
MSQLKLKICGLTIASQAAAMAQLGVDAIGVIAVKNSPRFLAANKRTELWKAVAAAKPQVQRVLVVVNPNDSELDQLSPKAGHQYLQLHGEETPERCYELKQQLGLPIWKALRLRQKNDLGQLQAFTEVAEKILLEPWVLGLGLEPYGIDASSSVEDSPGIKNINEVRNLLTIISTI